MNPIIASAALDLLFNLAGISIERGVPFRSNHPLTAQADQFYRSNEPELNATNKGLQVAEGLPFGQVLAVAIGLRVQMLINPLGP